MSLRVKYLVLREITILLGLYEWMAWGFGAYFLGAKEFTSSLAFYISMGISYYISTKLSYKVLELLIRLENSRRE